jgi:hypothetical protein
MDALASSTLPNKITLASFSLRLVSPQGARCLPVRERRGESFNPVGVRQRTTGRLTNDESLRCGSRNGNLSHARISCETVLAGEIL